MIIVLSYEDYEQGTEYVIDWLVYYKADFLKVTMKDFFNVRSAFTLDIDSRRLYLSGRDLSDRIRVIFYRRLFKSFTLGSPINEVFREQIEREVTDEIFALVQYLFFAFGDRVWLPPPQSANVNKLVMLDRARAAGLETPVSRVINNRKDLYDFYNDSTDGVITKPILKSGYYTVGRQTYFANVNPIDEPTVNSLPHFFAPSLFQQRLDREYEIRVFYLDGKFFSLAQLTNSAEVYVDIKLNNHVAGTEWVTYQLPGAVEIKIDRFMKSINLNTGSLDIVKLKNGSYCFLEVNPVGQYSHPSHFGNFELERLIAEWLIKKDKDGK